MIHLNSRIHQGSTVAPTQGGSVFASLKVCSKVRYVAPMVAGIFGGTAGCLPVECQNVSQQTVASQPMGHRPTTSFQILGEYNDRWDLGTDVVIIYFEDHTTNIERQIESWTLKGYEPWVMFNSSQDYTGAYVTGEYDAGKHRDVIQRAADGRDFGVFDQGAYLVPNPNWLGYQKQFVKRAIDAGAKAVVAEEPEFFATAGYSPTFKTAWKQEYGNEWVDPETDDRSRRMARRLMALLYQRHLKALFDYADGLHPTVKCLVAAHSPFDYAINPMVFPHAWVAALAEVDGYIAQVWSDTARSSLIDPTRGGAEVKAVFHKAFLEYNYFWNLLRGTNKELIFLQDPKSDSEGFSWSTYRHWYERTVMASTIFDVTSFEVMPWPDRFFVRRAPWQQQTSCLSVVRAMQDLRNHESNYATPYGMLVSDSMLWENPELEEVITGHLGIGVTMLRHGVPVDVIPIERAIEPEFLDAYRVIFSWVPQTKPQQAAIGRWVRSGGILGLLGGSQAHDTMFEELGIQIDGTQIRTDLGTLIGASHPLVRQLGQRQVIPNGDFLYAYNAPTANTIYTVDESGPAVAFEQSVDGGLVFYFGVPPESLAQSQTGAELIRGLLSYLSDRAGFSYQETDRISITRGPYKSVYAMRDRVELRGLAIDLLDPYHPLIKNKHLATDEVAFLYEIGMLPKESRVLYSSSTLGTVRRSREGMTFEAKGPSGTTGTTTIYSPDAKRVEVSARDAVTGRDQLEESRWSAENQTLAVVYRHAPERHQVRIEVSWRNR